MTTTSFTVCEYYGFGDPFFGGAADDRPLGPNGQFLTGCYSTRPESTDVAHFATQAAAEAASKAATNKRAGGLISVHTSSRPPNITTPCASS